MKTVINVLVPNTVLHANHNYYVYDTVFCFVFVLLCFLFF